MKMLKIVSLVSMGLSIGMVVSAGNDEKAAVRSCKELLAAVKPLVGAPLNKDVIFELQMKHITPFSYGSLFMIFDKLQKKMETYSQEPVYPIDYTEGERTADTTYRKLKIAYIMALLGKDKAFELYETTLKTFNKVDFASFKQKRAEVTNIYKTFMKLAKLSPKQLENQLSYVTAKLDEKQSDYLKTGVQSNAEARKQKRVNIQKLQNGIKATLNS